ncbi:UNVERIFIED_CONTAM: hypothetical protein Slati_3961400 [Sesamum latifolium]|uniref:Uncharacterized protein n=1 Tax=Sesamum latifolium TaxID=2727402 RepID=A0AAW2TNM4_9LAMI
MREGASVTICSQIAIETILWMAPNIASDSSSVEVSEEVLRLGGSVTGPTVPEGCGVG